MRVTRAGARTGFACVEGGRRDRDAAARRQEPPVSSGAEERRRAGNQYNQTWVAIVAVKYQY